MAASMITAERRRRRTQRLAALVPVPSLAERPRRRLTTAHLLGFGLMLPGALMLAFGAFLLGPTRLEASRSQDLLYAQLATDLREATAPVSGQIADGTPVGLLEVPSLHERLVFVMGAASEQTMLGPGLRHDSVLPGQAGGSVLVGRRATYGAPFSDLGDVPVGEVITITTGQGTFRYRVDLVRHSNDPETEIFHAASRLTLVTSDPALTPDRDIVVSASLVGAPQPRATGMATVADDASGHGSSGRGVALLLWSQALLLVVGLVTWAAMRLSKRGVWIGAVPVLVVVLWNVFENLAVLLPNTL